MPLLQTIKRFFKRPESDFPSIDWHKVGGISSKPTMTTIQADRQPRPRPPAPVSAFGCNHDYRLLNHQEHATTFYCSKCLDIKEKLR